MKHLLSYSVYQPLENLPGNGAGLKDIGCDGVELFTSFERVQQMYRSISLSVHLPFAISWYSVWTGADAGELDEENVKHIVYGRNRDEIVDNLRSAIEYASEIEPAYGVLHAGSTNLDEVMLREQTGNSRKILKEFCEMVNMTVSGFRGGEPPFRLAFENLWWPGLRLVEPWEYRFIDDHMEFDNWGFCLDTGHMMNTLPDAYDERACVERLMEIFGGYPDDMKERIGTVHLHMSTSAEYRNTFKPVERPPEETMQETVAKSYPHVMRIDQHRPFSSGGCKLLVDELSPDFVTHEMLGSRENVMKDFIQQRSFFPRDI
ncbi:MAG: sugar phosphate isomerase/epimerase [Candidatus Methanoplasma sp.]|jgi:sugar phosphate isomerase/epimerase|nr:sugar phosphate isomerase/epimerase [Candidatus Methanoplasma sp.]